MQTTPFYINSTLAHSEPVETTLSFKPFISHLQKLQENATGIKARFYQYVLTHFQPYINSPMACETDSNVECDQVALDLIFGTLSPVVCDENNYLWALSTPVPNKVFYSTSAFYNFVNRKKEIEVESVVLTSNEQFKKQQLAYIYRFILKHLYDFAPVLHDPVYYIYTDGETGLSRYYNIHVNTDFIKVEVKQELPELTFEMVENLLHGDDSLDAITEILPLSWFKFEGFSVITLEDVTERHAIEDIREAISSPHEDERELYKQAIHSLNILAESNDVQFGLLPFLKLNGEPVFDYTSCSQSILIQSAKKLGMAESVFHQIVKQYEAKPKVVFFNSISEGKQQKYPFLKVLKQTGIQSYAVIPVFYNKHIAGIMEVYAERELVFYENMLSRLEFAIPLIAQLLQNSIEHFNARIDEVIKDKFTSLQPAVQWKFNETAWEWLRIPHNDGSKIKISNIVFNDVYPLYGAIDIRNSTVERNQALQQDLRTVIKLLLKVLLTLDEQYPNLLWQTLFQKANEWLQIVDNFVNSSDEMLINEFLENEAGKALSTFRQEHPESAALVSRFLNMIAQDCEGPAFTQRNRLEVSMQMINSAVNGYFEKAQEQLQSLYPCYFEKIRTDGVEYDIYVGQAIAPKKPFSADYLKQIRMWQLTSMIEVSCLTHTLLEHMPAALQTTQLIFIHSAPIDISFRNDERRFDVEGAYNIRYEVIKKRIDKVLVRDTGERLTQPGKIALVYFTEIEAHEHIGYIEQLQKQNKLLPEVEHLELEELQGVIGLKALRVSINFEN
ncbi:GAF domain-containing protein [Mucilaginibacter robiniae]|uniref:GAF domain-containing protein n=1 Tax=Mucilaginibacter robiniae TaxID=2728022 RepID=A0A7L5E847_9SPHI|nr:GAF domain-containing protein [Mucilaginibacter robiniae]QJD97043.1 GAF domain-containing protein [Mucilaginibacter robiniae]